MPRPRVLTELDEWPRHQTIDTFNSVQTASPEWSDGYWHCFGDPAGEVNLITAIRLYPNTDVMDAYAIVSLDDGKQYNLRASRRLRPRIDELRVGPFWQEIIRGMRTLRIGCDDNAHGIEFDILWESKAPAYDEAPGVQYRLDGRLVAERSNYIQAADIAGWIRINGREWKFDFGDGWGGTRDHSWGIGAGTGTGAKPNPYVAPPLTPPEQGSFRSDGMRHWAVVNMPDRCLYYAFRLGEDGIYRASGTGRQSDVGVHSWVEYGYDSDKESFAYTDVSYLRPRVGRRLPPLQARQDPPHPPRRRCRELSARGRQRARLHARRRLRPWLERPSRARRLPRRAARRGRGLGRLPPHEGLRRRRQRDTADERRRLLRRALDRLHQPRRPQRHGRRHPRVRDHDRVRGGQGPVAGR